jgi:predicted aspartyl protease
MKKLLLAGAAALALTTAAMADNATQWDAGPQGPVYQVTSSDNNMPVCYIKLRNIAELSVGIYKYDDGGVRFSFSNGQSWANGGQVSFDIDGHVWWLNMRPSRNNGSLLVDAASETGDTLDLLHALFNGQSLTVTAGQQEAVIPLTGSATGIAVLNQCRDRIVAQKNATTTTTATTPTQPLTAPPQSSIGEAALTDNGQGTFNVRVSLNGSMLMNLTLDSGAAGLTIPRHVADELMNEGKLAPADFRGLVTSVLADNSKVINQLYILPSVTIAGRTVYDVPCVVGDDNTSMLLGQSVLQKFRSWSIDNERHVLVLNG